MPPPPPNDDLDWPSLMPEIERIARSVGRRKNASLRVKDELCNLAVGFVYEKSGYFDPSKGPFGAWSQTLLENKCIDLIKKEAADRRRIEGTRNQFEERERDSLGGPDEEEDPIPEVDWRDVFDKVKLKPIDRLLFALDVEICHRFEPDEIAAWIAGAGLPQDFPIDKLQAVPERSRNEAIATALLAAGGVEPGKKAIQSKNQWVRTRQFRAKTRIAKWLKGLP
jgi:hypothetical protein